MSSVKTVQITTKELAKDGEYFWILFYLVLVLIAQKTKIRQNFRLYCKKNSTIFNLSWPKYEPKVTF